MSFFMIFVIFMHMFVVLFSGPVAMNVVQLSTDLYTAARYDSKFDKPKPHPYNCNAFVVESARELCENQQI